MIDSDKRQKRLHALHRSTERLTRRLEILQAKNNIFSTYRLLVVLSGGGMSAAAFIVGFAPLGWFLLAITMMVFVVMVRFHRRIRAGITQFEGWRKIQHEHMARMKLDWTIIPASGCRNHFAASNARV